LKNELHLGKDNGDLFIADSELCSNHIMLEVQGTDLLIHPQRQVEHYLINGKRATAIRKLKVNDEVTIGKTIFRILDFSETTIESKKNILNQKLNKLIEEDSPRLAVIEKLNNLMKQ
jgi:hypothetical protein